MKNLLTRKVSNQELRREIKIIDILIAMIIVVFAIISIIYYKNLKVQISLQVETYGLIGLFLISAFMDLVPQIFSPVFPMIVLIVAGFNVHLAILVACLGAVAGSILGFEIGRKYGFKYLEALFEDDSLKKIDYFIKKYGKFFIALAALTPLPYFPMIFGAMNFSRRDFFVYGLICRILELVFLGYAVYFGFVSMNL